MNPSDSTNAMTHAALFPPTRWSVVDRARGTDTDASEAAIEALCATYWKPIYGYIVHLGQSVQDAEDLTQEFFEEQFGRRNLFLEARREKGKLRTYVCFAVYRHVNDELRKRGRIKRGGGQDPVPLDTVKESATTNNGGTPDKDFDQRWAAALVNRALAELEADYVARGKEALFNELRPFLETEGQDAPQQEIAERLGMTVGAVGMSLTRMRRRLGAHFRRKVAETVQGDRAAVDEEIRYLVSLF
ncbi:MAG: sigma-70 family RNA polymerase sigma factor [Verrucomicrobiae bacterium]|nr:sigma-70 family RNA polymerase sigma factor [Verrucomicrobiae bacterium]